MKLRSLSGVAAGVLALGIALPTSSASADTAPTPITLDVTTGLLLISVPGSASLGSKPNTVSGITFSAPLGQVQVNDARGAAAGSGWVTSVISTALTPAAGPTIGAALIGYVAGPVAKVGTATYTANDPTALDGEVAAVTATAITGVNSATWNPTINVAVPGGAVVGHYTGTITHSLV